MTQQLQALSTQAARALDGMARRLSVHVPEASYGIHVVVPAPHDGDPHSGDDGAQPSPSIVTVVVDAFHLDLVQGHASETFISVVNRKCRPSYRMHLVLLIFIFS